MPRKKVLQFIHGFSMGGAETLVKEYLEKNSLKIKDIIDKDWKDILY